MAQNVQVLLLENFPEDAETPALRIMHNSQVSIE